MRLLTGFFPLLLFQTAFAAPSGPIASLGAPLSKTVGAVTDQTFTSREVYAAATMERVLTGAKDPFPAGMGKGDIDRLNLSTLLLESAVSREAENFSLNKVSDEDVSEHLQKVEKVVASRAEWKKLEMTNTELRRLMKQKLAARAFIRLKTESMTGIISDAEAQAYFEKNRGKFGTLPFSAFKENIKSFLAQQQLEDRLRSWFEILRRKYKVREFRHASTAPARPTSPR